MKVSQKQKLIDERNNLSNILDTMLEEVGEERIIQFLTGKLDENLEAIEERIEDEQNFANENKTGAYRSAGTEARKTVKYLKTVKKKHLQLIKMFQEFLKIKQKVYLL